MISVERFGLLGNPLEHSLSPALHQAAYDALGLPWSYALYPGDQREALRALSSLSQGVVAGLNVTTPYKTFLMAFCEDVDESASYAGGVNTLYMEGECLKGCNTDGQGALSALESAGFTPADKRILICGTGATAAACGSALLCGYPNASVCFMSRDVGRAQALVDRLALQFKHRGRVLASGSFVASGYDQATRILPSMDCVINASILGMKEDDPSPLPADALRKGQYLLDAVYRNVTRLQMYARQAGCALVDGRDMLVEQALCSLLVWAGNEGIIFSSDQERCAREAMHAAVAPAMKGDD